jgi:hypothetical protein
MAKDWSKVAVAITRKTRKRPAVLAAMFLWFATGSPSPPRSMAVTS